jgi:hypothetical protein
MQTAVQCGADWAIVVRDLPVPAVVVIPERRVIIIDPREVERRLGPALELLALAS